MDKKIAMQHVDTMEPYEVLAWLRQRVAAMTGALGLVAVTEIQSVEDAAFADGAKNALKAMFAVLNEAYLTGTMPVQYDAEWVSGSDKRHVDDLADIAVTYICNSKSK